MEYYHPLDTGLSTDCLPYDLQGFDWQTKSADFQISNDEQHILRVQFGAEVIVRMLDEMFLSFDGDGSAPSGELQHHFAYRVEGALFAESAAWKPSFPMKHYRFLTGWGCLDVLTPGEPNFALVPVAR